MTNNHGGSMMPEGQNPPPLGERVRVLFPSGGHYENALFVDSLRWQGGKLDSTLLEMFNTCILRLTNTAVDPDDVIERLLEQLSKVALMKVLQPLVAMSAEPCTDPECPVHGQPKKADPNDLDTAFGIGDFKL